MPAKEIKSTSPGWLLLILTLQGHQPAVRMRVWRALKALGTAVLRDGVYLLPNIEAFMAPLQAQAREVIDSGGSAQIMELSARDTAQEQEFRTQFDRTAEYGRLMQEIAGMKRALAQSDVSSWVPGVERLRRGYEEIALQDFFPGSAHDQTREALMELAAAVSALLSPDEPHATEGRIMRRDPAQYRGRLWATRARPWADRLASAWLIRRFIDPQAKIMWLKNPADCPKRALGFDFDNAVFTHVGAKVTFEVLLASFGLTEDESLGKIGHLIHFLDVGGVPTPEAAGLEALLRGARTVLSDDDVLLAEVSRWFDYLYATFAQST